MKPNPINQSSDRWVLESSRVARSAGSVDRAVNAPVVAPEVVPDLARTSEPIAALKPAVEPAETGLGAAFRVLGMALFQAPEPDVRSGWGWQAWVAVGAMAGIGVGLVRFGFGLLAVRMLRRGSRPLEDDSMRELADRIRAELGLARAVVSSWPRHLFEEDRDAP